MRARGRSMTWWARTAQKSGSRLMPNAARRCACRQPARTEPWLRTKIWLPKHRVRGGLNSLLYNSLIGKIVENSTFCSIRAAGTAPCS